MKTVIGISNDGDEDDDGINDNIAATNGKDVM